MKLLLLEALGSRALVSRAQLLLLLLSPALLAAAGGNSRPQS